MIINREHTEATVSANVETYSGSIALNAETFDIIISGIYKFKLLAAMREPIFNAFDSHIEANRKDVPIIIHSPTNLEPWFSVKDSGIGMDKDMVTVTFMTFGESTKRKSNEVVGSKGIGSKAPFAFTDMFTVTSVKDGMETVYSIYKDRGLPKNSVLKTLPTDKPNGVEVSFPVPPDKVNQARNDLKSCLRYVKSPYEINDPYLKQLLEEDKPICFNTQTNSDGWTIEFYQGAKSDNKNVVVMGQQPYVSETLSDYPACAVFIPIGDCDVSPGREYTVEGDDDGGFSAKLKAFVENSVKNVGASIVAEMEKTKTITEAREYLHSQKGSYFLTRFGYGWLMNKIYAIIDSTPVSSKVYETWRGKLKLDYQKNLGPREFIDTCNSIIYVDKKIAIKRKATSLVEDNWDVKKVWLVYPDPITDKLVSDPYFKDAFIFATSLIPPKEVKIREKRTGNIRAVIIPRGGVAYEQWVNKCDLEDVEYYMIRDAKNQGDRTWLGDFTEMRHYAGNEFEGLGVEGDEIWLITETAEKHLPASAVKVTIETWRKNIQPLYDNWVLRKSLNRVVRKKREIRKLFGGRYLPLRHTDEEFSHKLNNFWGAEHYLQYPELSYTRAAKIKNRYDHILESKQEEAMKKYPLLRYVGFKRWKSPEFKEYREMIDNKGEK